MTRAESPPENVTDPHLSKCDMVATNIFLINPSTVSLSDIPYTGIFHSFGDNFKTYKHATLQFKKPFFCRKKREKSNKIHTKTGQRNIPASHTRFKRHKRM